MTESIAQQPQHRNPWDAVTLGANGHAHISVVSADSPPDSMASMFRASILPGQNHSLSGVSARAFALGITLGCSCSAAVYLLWRDLPLWRAPFFLAVLSLFHFLEFYSTARYNTEFATTSAFLLSSNGLAYNIAHTCAILETTLFHSILSHPFRLAGSWSRFAMVFGLVLLVLGQVTRTLAMAHAGKSFNHTVQFKKTASHELITHGIYAVLRHPSYFGFFWWGLGSQIVLGNALCFTGYTLVLWKFFNTRIKKEEGLLLKFFGNDYESYRQRTPVGIPFIR